MPPPQGLPTDEELNSVVSNVKFGGDTAAYIAPSGTRFNKDSAATATTDLKGGQADLPEVDDYRDSIREFVVRLNEANRCGGH